MRRFASACGATSARSCASSSFENESRWLRVGKETSAFRSTLDRRLSHLPCDVRDTRRRPRTDSEQLKEARSAPEMTCLDWKSKSVATVVHRLPKGNG